MFNSLPHNINIFYKHAIGFYYSLSSDNIGTLKAYVQNHSTYVRKRESQLAIPLKNFIRNHIEFVLKNDL